MYKVPDLLSQMRKLSTLKVGKNYKLRVKNYTFFTITLSIYYHAYAMNRAFVGFHIHMKVCMYVCTYVCINVSKYAYIVNCVQVCRYVQCM